MRRAALVFAGMVAVTPPAEADSAMPRWSPVPASATYQTGDSWTNGGVTHRLYGVQSCLRGTSFTNAYGAKRDCGEASLAMLVALVRDLRPQCHEAARLGDGRTLLVFCVSQPTRGAGAGSRIDLGTALIASGFAFAALDQDGRPVHPPYLAAQQVAERSQAGLWAFADLPNPTALIQRALEGQASTVSSAPVPGIDPTARDTRRPRP